jgi:hypothetical protein
MSLKVTCAHQILGKRRSHKPSDSPNQQLRKHSALLSRPRVRQRQFVSLALVVPPRIVDIRASHEMSLQLVLREHVVPVLPDFRLRRVVAFPVWIELGREGVPVAWDVRSTAWVRVILVFISHVYRSQRPCVGARRENVPSRFRRSRRSVRKSIKKIITDLHICSYRDGTCHKVLVPKLVFESYSGRYPGKPVN